MKKIIVFLFIISFLSCNGKHNAQLEINLLPENGDSIQELKTFYLQSMDLSEYKKSQAENRKIKSFNFENIGTKKPNSFLITTIDSGTYFGLISIIIKNVEYNINIDSIHIRPGMNQLLKKISFSSIRVKEIK